MSNNLELQSAEVQVIYLFATQDPGELSAERPSLYVDPEQITMFTRAYPEKDFEGDWEPILELELPCTDENEKAILALAGEIEDLLILLLGEDQVSSEVYKD